MTRLEAALGRVKRVHFKSLGGLLVFQEKLVAEGKLESADRGTRALELGERG